MKISCFSDCHGQLPSLDEIPECDVLLIAGDIAPNFVSAPNTDARDQCWWLRDTYLPWEEKVLAEKAKHIVATVGNHDWWAMYQPTNFSMNWFKSHILIDQSVTIYGTKFYGTPWNLYFHGWAFNLYENDIKEKFDAIPIDTDVLICHQPPFGYGDDAIDGRGIGSHCLINKILEIQPKLAVFGHIHEGYGRWEMDNLYKTQLANVSYLARNYKTKRPIMEFII